MIVLVHVLIALSSLAFASYVFARPSLGRLRISYSLIGATLASGTYLVISTHSPLLQACLMGLVYLAIATTATLAAHKKLAKN